MKILTVTSGATFSRLFTAFALGLVGVFLATLSFAANPTPPGWSIVTSPNSSATQTNYLNGVTCVAANDCWAVGYYNDGSGVAGTGQTLIEHWNGTAWSISPSPNGGTRGNLLEGVTCTSAANCWAVGYYYNANNVAQTLVERWNGTVWSV